MKMIYSILMIVGFLSTQCLPATAQFKQVAESPAFEETVTGHARILQMKNGNTVFLHITPKEGIDIRIYDAAHQEKIATNVELSIKRVKLSTEMSMFPTANDETVEGIFEINNDIVVFLYEYEPPKRSALCRIIIDGSTGKLKEETELFNKRSGSYSVEPNIDRTGYFIRMYDYSEAEEKGNERIIYYDAAHKETNSWAFTSPEKDDNHKSLFYKGMIAGENGNVYAFYVASAKANDYKGNVYMVSMQKGSEKVSFNKLDLTADLFYVKAIIRYDPLDKSIVFLILSKLNLKASDLDEHLNVIDLATMKNKRIHDFGASSSLQQAYIDRFDKKKGYDGIPQDMFVNADGSISIVYEQMLIQSTSSGSYTRTDTKLSKIVISTVDKQGKRLSEYVVPKEHWVIFTRLDMLYHNELEGKAQHLWRGNEYKVFKYIDAPNGRFILFNDTDRNNDVNKDKFVEVQGVKDCDAYMCKLSGTDVFPQRIYGFGEQKKGHAMAMFSVSEYDRKANTIVTIKNDSERGKNVKLVWLQPE